MPHFSERSPTQLLKIVMRRKISVLRRMRASVPLMETGDEFAIARPLVSVRPDTSGSVPNALRHRVRSLSVFLDELLALAAQRHILFRFLVETFAIVAIEDRFAHNPPRSLGTEIVFSVEPLHPFHQLSPIQNA